MVEFTAGNIHYQWRIIQSMQYSVKIGLYAGRRYIDTVVRINIIERNVMKGKI